jgi:SnoaL-like domain
MSGTKDAEMPYAATANMLARLFLTLDSNDYSDVASCFHTTGVWHRQGQILTGRPDIVSALEKRPAGRKTLHVITNIVADSTDVNATDASFFI